jgi:hypothetical protein
MNAHHRRPRARTEPRADPQCAGFLSRALRKKAGSRRRIRTTRALRTTGARWARNPLHAQGTHIHQSLHNERRRWLPNAHKALDRAVAASCGWPLDISTEGALARLPALNSERRGSRGKTALTQHRPALGVLRECLSIYVYWPEAAGGRRIQAFARRLHHRARLAPRRSPLRRGASPNRLAGEGGAPGGPVVARHDPLRPAWKARLPSKGGRKIFSPPLLYENQNLCYDLPIVGMWPPDAWPLGERTWSRGAPRQTPRAQPDGRVEGEADFFIFFACNPLKSPDSEK